MEHTRGPTNPSHALRCEEARVWLMGYIDGELEPGQRRAVEEHLAVCVSCRSDELAYRRLGHVAETTLTAEDGSVDTAAAWTSIYTRIERGVGWTLLWIGILLLSGFGLWQLFSEFLLNSEVPIVYRVGTGAFTLGALVLLVSFLREHLHKYGSERYREVER